MFDDLLNEQVTIRKPDGVFTDGQTGYQECVARAFVFNYNERLLKEIGLVRDARFFVIAATPESIAALTEAPAGTVIGYGGRDYDLKSVRPCREIDGRIACFSCAGV